MSAWIPVCINLEHFIVFTFSGEERESFIAGTPYLYKEVLFDKNRLGKLRLGKSGPIPCPWGPWGLPALFWQVPSQAPSATPQTPLLQHIS